MPEHRKSCLLGPGNVQNKVAHSARVREYFCNRSVLVWQQETIPAAPSIDPRAVGLSAEKAGILAVSEARDDLKISNCCSYHESSRCVSHDAATATACAQLKLPVA